MTPAVWMEARCGSVCSPESDGHPSGCQETSEGMFATNVFQIRDQVRRQGWVVMRGHWWCPYCARKLRGE